MKVYLELATSAEGTDDPIEIADAQKTAQSVANKLGVTVQLTNGNYGAYIIEPERGMHR